MMVDKRSLSKYLRDLEIYVEKLKLLQKENKVKILKDWRIQAQVERYLQISIECLLNIGEMVINGCKFRKPQNYRDIIKILGENKILTCQVEKGLDELAKFRNILVHEYIGLDYEKIYFHLKKDPQVINQFIKAVKVFLSKGS